MPHPIAPAFSEIYARYIIPRQYKYHFKELGEVSIEAFKDILSGMIFWRQLFWQTVGCPCKACVEKFKPKYDFKTEIDKEFKNNILIAIGENKNCNQMSRSLPYWEYYKNFEKGISVLKSGELASLYSSFGDENAKVYIHIEGVNGELVFNEFIKNTISKETKSKTKEIFEKLGEERNDVVFYPSDNITIAISGDYIIFHDVIADEYEFKKEKEQIRNRHIKESSILFPISEFIWNDEVDPDAFESLIKDLLSREPGVLRVRKVSPLNQPDNGRDIILEKNEAVDFSSEDGHSPYQTIKMIVQCKASKNNVGKGQVRDIRDTIDSHNYDGYFLAVSSQLTTPLTNYLDELRNRGLNIDWWNRDDIEERLNSHQDLILKYTELVDIKD